MRYLTLLLTLIISLTATAQVCPNHQLLKSGDLAPCNGHFFNNETEQSIRKDVRDGELRKKQIQLKDLQIKQLSEDRNMWADEAHKQAKARHELDSDLTKGVLGGIALTLLVMFGIGQVNR